METIVILVFLVVISGIFIGLLRWIFRLDHIVKVLKQTADHLKDIKQQNKVLIKQQEEIIGLLEDEISDAWSRYRNYQPCPHCVILKTEFFCKVEALGLRQALFPSQEEPVDAIVQQLELINPISSPLQPNHLPSLLGRWQLVYASQGTVVTRWFTSIADWSEGINIKQIQYTTERSLRTALTL